MEWPRALLLGSALVYLLATLSIGVWAARRTKNAKDFFIAGQKIGRKLNALRIQVDRFRERLHELGLAESRESFEKDVPTRNEPCEHVVDETLLTEQDTVQGASEPCQSLG